MAGAPSPDVAISKRNMHLGRTLHGKAALIEEVKAAVRLQRSVRGAQTRSRMLREETGAGRLHGGIEHLSLAGVVHLARAARKEPHRRDEEDVELLGRSLRRV